MDSPWTNKPCSSIMCVTVGNIMPTYVNAYRSAHVSADTVIHSLSRPPPKNWKNQRNKRFISLKTRARRERAVTWRNPAAQTCPVLDSHFLCPRTHAKTSKSLIFTSPVLDSHSFVPIPLLSYGQEREKVHSKCTMQCTAHFVIIYIMLVMSYCT
jgi:hypothetical protein